MKNKFQMAFGGLSRISNLADFDLGTLTPIETIPTIFLPSYPLIIESQLQLPDCGANAGVVLKEVFENTPRLSVEYLWDKIKLIDGFSPESGTNMLYIMKVLNKTGVCEYSLLPTDSTLGLVAFTDPTKITPAQDTDAFNRRIGSYAFTQNPNFEQIKKAIFVHKAVILLMRVGKEFWTSASGVSSWAEKDILPLSPNFPITSGHFVVAFAYDEKYIYFQNSWSSLWGRVGIGYFGTDYASRVIEMGTSVNLINSDIIYPIIRFGSTGTFVNILQKILNMKINAGLKIDGNFGKLTQSAVMNFQTQNGLVVDGISGPITWAQLLK